METTTRLLLPDVILALREEPDQLLPLIEELHPADLADLAEALTLADAQKLLTLVPTSTAARILENYDGQQLPVLFATLAHQALDKAAAITDQMAHDDRADLYATLGEELRADLLEALEEEESRDIRKLLSYPEGSAGALLTTDFVALPADSTAAESIELVRVNAADMETIYQAYAVDTHGTLLGAVSLRDLVTSPVDRLVDEIMNPFIVSVNVEADQEDVARLIAKYDLLALPVVDRAHRIVGIVTVDDIIDVVEEEATEDVQRLGAVEPLEQSYLNTPIKTLIRARAPWLVVLFVAVLATRNVLEHYSQIDLETIQMLMWFVPLIVSAGGNAGSQSATLIIRALATGHIGVSDAKKILIRELIVGLSLGLLLALVGIVSVAAWDSTRTVGMISTVCIAVIVVVTMGALLGSGIPLLLEKIGIDPAVASTPFITSLVDIFGLMVYFEVARVLL